LQDNFHGEVLAKDESPRNEYCFVKSVIVSSERNAVICSLLPTLPHAYPRSRDEFHPANPGNAWCVLRDSSYRFPARGCFSRRRRGTLPDGFLARETLGGLVAAAGRDPDVDRCLDHRHRPQSGIDAAKLASRRARIASNQQPREDRAGPHAYAEDHVPNSARRCSANRADRSCRGECCCCPILGEEEFVTIGSTLKRGNGMPGKINRSPTTRCPRCTVTPIPKAGHETANTTSRYRGPGTVVPTHRRSSPKQVIDGFDQNDPRPASTRVRASGPNQWTWTSLHRWQRSNGSNGKDFGRPSPRGRQCAFGHRWTDEATFYADTPPQ